MTDHRPPRDNLVRALFPATDDEPAAAIRDDDGEEGVLFGHFARFNEWTKIDSVFEGTFMERVAPGAFAKTFQERRPKITLNHGQDPELGDKPIAAPTVLEEDDVGARYEAKLLDGVPQLVVSGLRAGQYGASFRFRVTRDDYDRSPKESDHNPDALPERTIREAELYEFGPVTWPAYAGATAGVRSLTDDYVGGLLNVNPQPTWTSASPIETAPSVDAGAEPHLEPERRDDPSPEQQETIVSEEYKSPEEKESRVAELKSELKRLGDEFTGVMPVEQQARWDADTDELRRLEADLVAHSQRQSFLRSIADNPANVDGIPSVIRTRTAVDIYDPDQFSGIRYRTTDERNQTLRDNAMRSLETSYLPKGAATDELARWLDNRDIPAVDASPEFGGLPEIASRILVTGSPVYKRAFAKYLRHGNSDMFTEEEKRAAALAVVGTTTTGGYAVPYVFDPTILRIGVYTAQNPYRQACRTETISGGNVWTTVTVGAATTAYVAEAAAATEQGPTFGQPSYTVQRGHTFATVSIETLQDRPDITEELTAVFAESKATYEENQFTLGTGATVFPLGMFVDTAYTDKTTAANDVTAIGDLAATEAVLPLRHRANAAWFMNRSTLRQLQALDTTYRVFSGANINFPGQSNPNQPVTGGNTGVQCLGYPIWEVPSAVSTLTVDGAIIAVFCDPSSYIIVDRLGMTVEVIPNMLNGATPSFPTGQRGIYAYFRNTAKPINADAGRSLSVQ